MTASTLLAYLSVAARMTKPSTILTRAIQLPLLGSRVRNDGNSASPKNGSASPEAKATIPASGLQPPPDYGAGEQGPYERPHAGEGRQREGQAIKSVPSRPPFREA